jgi:hypothetical protein
MLQNVRKFLPGRRPHVTQSSHLHSGAGLVHSDHMARRLARELMANAINRCAFINIGSGVRADLGANSVSVVAGS